MVDEDNKDTIRVVAELTAESGNYRRQFVIWLGVGSGAGVAAVLTFAEKFDDPVNILRALLPSLVCFALGVAGAAASVLFASLRDGATANHQASAHNARELAKAVQGIPEVFSSPRRIADEMNVGRNRYVERHKVHNDRSEAEWRKRLTWSRLYLTATALSICGFLVGASYPLALIAQNSPLLHQRNSPPSHTAK